MVESANATGGSCTRSMYRAPSGLDVLVIGENIQCLLQSRKYVLLNVCAQNLSYFFLEHTEDVLPEDTGKKQMEKICLASVR